MKTFNVLPTDERFLNLTAEQKEFLWQNYLLDHPEIERKINGKIYDPDFEKEWESMDVETTEEDAKKDGEAQELYVPEDEDFSAVEESFAKFLEERPDLKIDEDKLQQLVNDPEEWEEVDD